MVYKVLHPIFFIFLIFILLAPLGHASTPSDKNSSPFDFLKKLKGCHKGNNTTEIHKLKAYLEQFGYLKYEKETHAIDDDFDDILESAIKTYQKNYRIKSSGIVDDETISIMTSPRCGVPDIINNINYMQSHDKKHKSSSSNIHTTSHYSFFNGSLKWPDSKTHLTYRFLSNVPAYAIAPVQRAFQTWKNFTHFTFAQVQTNQNSDLLIAFYRGAHGDYESFDSNGPLAHAFAPTNGSFHYNADMSWSIGAFEDYFDLETVALHEIGHLLGLHHSSVDAAIMYPIIYSGVIKELHEDDIQGIRALYNR